MAISIPRRHPVLAHLARADVRVGLRVVGDRLVAAAVGPAHDVVAVMYLVRPELFTKKSGRVEVELQGTLTRGMSVVDWRGRWGKPNNCEVLMTVDNDKFNSEFVAAMGKLPYR